MENEVFLGKYNPTDGMKWLDEFTEATKKKEYERIDYEAWRLIKKTLSNKVIKITARCDIARFNVESLIFDTNSLLLLVVKENSFAKFLVDKYFNNKIIDILYGEEMTTATNNTITTNYNNGSVTTSYLQYNGGNATWVASDSVSNVIDEITNKIKNIECKINEKEQFVITMDNNVFTFDFGPIGTHPSIRMSMYGFAIKNKQGRYVAYDHKTDRIMDAEVFNFQCDNLFYKIPKPIADIDIGDVIFHNGTPMFVEDATEDDRLDVIDPYDGTAKTIMPMKSPFGFDYVTTLVSLMDYFSEDLEPDEDSPFGKMLPLMLLSQDNKDNMLPYLMLMNGKINFDNPMMLLALSGGKIDTSNPFMMMMMMKNLN